MGGTIKINYLSKKKNISVVIDVKYAPHICRSYDFLYEDGDIEKQIEKFSKLNEKMGYTEKDIPTYGDITINHINKTLVSNQTYFDINNYSLFLQEIINPPITDYKTGIVFFHPLGKAILENILDMVNRRIYKKMNFVIEKQYHSHNILDYTEVYKTLEIPEKIWNENDWRNFILSHITDVQNLNGRIFSFDLSNISMKESISY